MKAELCAMELPPPYRQRARRLIYRCRMARFSVGGFPRALATSNFHSITELLHYLSGAANDPRIPSPESAAFWKRVGIYYQAVIGSPHARFRMRARGGIRLPQCPPTMRYRNEAERRFSEV